MAANREGGEGLLLLALALGVLGDVLFRNAGWGINVTIWLFAAFGGVVLMRKTRSYPALSGWIWVAAGLSVLAIFRDAFTLKLITVIALVGAISYSTLSTERVERVRQTVFTYLGRMVDTLISGVRVFHASLALDRPSDTVQSILRESDDDWRFAGDRPCVSRATFVWFIAGIG